MSGSENKEEFVARGDKVLKMYHEADLEPKLVALANAAASKGHYKEALSLLDNLMKMQPKNKKLIVELSIKFQKKHEAEEKNKEMKLS